MRRFGPAAHLLIFCNPYNPLGRVSPGGDVAIAGVVDRHGGRVFSDEIHAPLVYGPPRPVRVAVSGRPPRTR